MTDPVHLGDNVTLYLADCLEVMRGMPDRSVDAVVTDPPYGHNNNGDLIQRWEAALGTGPQGEAWKDVRDDDDMDEDEVNDLWRAETDAYIALEAAVAPLLIEVTE